MDEEVREFVKDVVQFEDCATCGVNECDCLDQYDCNCLHCRAKGLLSRISDIEEQGS